MSRHLYSALSLLLIVLIYVGVAALDDEPGPTSSTLTASNGDSQ